jgi:hypothetical protein
MVQIQSTAAHAHDQRLIRSRKRFVAFGGDGTCYTILDVESRQMGGQNRDGKLGSHVRNAH